MIQTLRSNRLLFFAVALALVALAFFLRVYRLGDQNIWWDEGWTVWMGQHDFAWIALRTAADEHPPLHYWAMNLWQQVFGPNVVTGRYFSLAFGVLLVALTYRLGKDMGGARLGLLGALFLSLARFNVWWSQDIKNYTLSAFFAWVSVWCVWKLTTGERRTTNANFFWLGYVLAAALALYSHYLAVLIILANNLFVGVVLLARWRGREPYVPLLVRWALAQIAVVVLFAPWLYLYLQKGATWSAAPAFDFGLFLQLAATVLTLVLIATLSLGWLVLALRLGTTRDTTPAASVGRGKASIAESSVTRAWATTYLLLITLVPPVLIYALSLTPAAIFAPKIQARYLMMLTPAVALLLGLGILFAASRLRGRAAQIATAALALVVVAAQLFTLSDYFRERYLRDEYLTLAQFINNFGFADDAIVLNTDQEYPTFLYYLNPRPDFGSVHWVSVPNGAPVTSVTAQRAAADAAQARAVWVVTIPDALQKDPQGLVEQELSQRLPKQFEQTFGDKRLALYTNDLRNVKDVPRENFSPLIARNDVFDDRLTLMGVDVPIHEALPGDIVRVVTYWAVLDDTTINLSLQTPQGEVVSNASIPIAVGARERAQGDLQIPPDVSASELRVVAQARLHARELDKIHIRPRATVAPSASDAVMQPRAETFGEQIRLVGISLPSGTFRPGESVPITLFWQADAPIPISYTVFVHFLGDQYNPSQNNFLWGQIDRLPLDGKLPTTAWTPGQTVADSYLVEFDDAAPGGTYKIEIGLYDAAGNRLRVSDANNSDLGDVLIVGEIPVE